MKFRLQNLLFLFHAFVIYLINYYSQKRFFNKFNELHQILNNSKPTLKKYDLFRIKDYSLRLYAICGGIHRYLSDKKLTQTERIRLTLLGAFSPIYDDFIDATKENIVNLKIFVKNPFYYIPINLKEKAGQEILKKLFAYNKHRLKDIYPHIYKTHLAQLRSKKQKNNTPSNNELEKITYAKGGYSILLSRYMIDTELIDNEYEMWYNLGALLQLLDDIFDIFNDISNNIHTLANTTDGIASLEKYLDSSFNSYMNVLKKLNYSNKGKSKVIYLVYLLFTAGKTMIYQLKRLTKDNKEIDFTKYSARELRLNNWSFSNIIYILKLALNFKLNIDSVEKNPQT